jgi:hypothetical protein
MAEFIISVTDDGRMCLIFFDHTVVTTNNQLLKDWLTKEQ